MKKAPAIFLGHGSPMNVIENNSFNDEFKNLSKKLDLKNIKGIICISAHYQTDGIQIDQSAKPKTIHDFSGFPDVLYQMHYNAPGSIELANNIKEKLKAYNPITTTNWGFDHGAWNVLWHLVPEANIPVVMVSLDYNLSFEEHFNFGKLLGELRTDGFMILGSGNVVHSFKGINFKENADKNKLAVEFENYVLNKLKTKNYNSLLKFDESFYESAKFSVNSSEHYVPFLYILGASSEEESATIFNVEIVYSTLSMLSVSFGVE